MANGRKPVPVLIPLAPEQFGFAPGWDGVPVLYCHPFPFLVVKSIDPFSPLFALMGDPFLVKLAGLANFNAPAHSENRRRSWRKKG